MIWKQAEKVEEMMSILLDLGKTLGISGVETTRRECWVKGDKGTQSSSVM